MFLIRQAKVDDATSLLKLAKMVHFINLPADPDIISAKIARSRKSFAGNADDVHEREFVFVLEDANTGNVIGTSGIVSAISWPGRPHTFLKVRKREFYSEDLQTGAVHTTLQLGTDESGPSEIGGLILSPSYRGHAEKLGVFLSLIRFHFMGLHREWFADRILAEMMAPLTTDSRNLLWEYLGRRFINLTYPEADRFCQYSKEFITSLFPKEELYVSLLPAEARNLIGKVGPETAPARRMLEGLGFRHNDCVDPFDGGPYLEAQMGDISIVQDTRPMTLAEPSASIEPTSPAVFVSAHDGRGFRAIRTPVAETPEGLTMPQEAMEALRAKPGVEVGYTPRDKAAGRREKPRERERASA